MFTIHFEYVYQSEHKQQARSLPLSAAVGNQWLWTQVGPSPWACRLCGNLGMTTVREFVRKISVEEWFVVLLVFYASCHHARTGQVFVRAAAEAVKLYSSKNL